MAFSPIQQVFFRQFWALCRKNWIVLSKHKLLNLFRCILLPIGYGVLLGVAQTFFTRPNHYGLGTPVPVMSLADVMEPQLALIWADGTNTSSDTHPSPTDVMNIVLQPLSPAQRAAVHQVATPDDIATSCPQNFNLFSECFAGVAFNSFPTPSNATTGTTLANTTILKVGPQPPTGPSMQLPNGTQVLPPSSLLNYTISGDGGLGFIDVVDHKSDFEVRVLPLQWAIDSAIIQLQTGISTPPPTPLEWPYSIETDQQQSNNLRISFIRGIRTLLVLALFVNFLGIPYHLPGSYVMERNAGLTSHLRAMGLRDFPRILSWHVSMSLAYLPGWLVTAILWRIKIFSGTSYAIIIFLHLLTGLSLGSFSLFVSLPSLPASLSASTSTLLALILAVVGQVLVKATTGAACILVLIFPPSFYVFAVRTIAGFELHQIPTSMIKGDPDHGVMLLPLFVMALFNVFFYPWLTVQLERYYYDAHDPSPQSKRSWLRPWRTHPSVATASPSENTQDVSAPSSESPAESPAIIIKHLEKTFQTTRPTIFRPTHWFSKKKPEADADTVTAIQDLSFTVPRGGIFVLLGSNGAGKSTALGVMGGLIGRTGGSVMFPPADATRRPPNKEAEPGTEPDWDGPSRLPKGVLGLVPQKNILFPELTCFETMQLWHAVKRPMERRPGDSAGNQPQVHVEETPEELERLLTDCGLEGKLHSNAGSLSGGQKRKLQLAIGLVGGSEIVLVDECTSGVDPLSRRSMWRTLTAVKTERTIVLTTHFLDEADLLADGIAILATPGKLVAEGSPVALKSRLGRGYTVNISFNEEEQTTSHSAKLLQRIQDFAPDATLSSTSPNGSAFCLQSKDSNVVKQVLETLQAEKKQLGVTGYEIHGTAIEDIFLELMAAEAGLESTEMPEKPEYQVSDEQTAAGQFHGQGLQLTSGRKKSPLTQSLTILYKRTLIIRRSWLSSLLTVLLAVAGACIPTFFMNGRAETCAQAFTPSPNFPLYLGDSQLSAPSNTIIPGGQVLVSPPNLITELGASIAQVPFVSIPDNTTFVNTILQNYQNLSLGGLSMDTNTGNTLFAWQGNPPGMTAVTLLNLASNLLYNRALNASGRAANQPSIISANYQSFPVLGAGTLFALKWSAFFGATMAVFPAFFAMYVALERRSSVQAMQLSNGLTNPAGLWLGHLLFDGIFCIILSTIITIVFSTMGTQFHGLGYFWLIMVLYGFAATLFAYCVSLFTPSPLAAFAAVAGYQVVIYILYLSGYLLTITYAKNSQAAGIITKMHFGVSVTSPVTSVMRAALVSVNLFSLLCANSEVSTNGLGTMVKFGGPITYLIVDCLVLFAFLVYVDSGSVLPRWLQFTRPPAREVDAAKDDRLGENDVAEETAAVESSSTDLLRVLHVSKTFDRSTKAVDDVSFGVSKDTVFAMLGPNGAGKTSTFNVIRGDINPDAGDVFINGTSIIAHPNTARLSLGVCPQFSAIDPQLTVRQHLVIYGLLKGLKRGPELDQNVESLLRATTLSPYADRLANKLSGGNQRKLSFAIALIGNPTVILIDEYSTGIDAATKRSMWVTFRRMAVGKAVVITTHSMEEASALANKVGILAGRMLAIGSTEALAGRYALYEVHFPGRTREEIVKAQQLMARIPGSRMADDVATRFEVPIRTEDSHQQPSQEEQSSTPEGTLSLPELFETLNTQSDFPEYTVERISLESVFLKVIRAHNIQEEDTRVQRKKSKGAWRVC